MGDSVSISMDDRAAAASASAGDSSLAAPTASLAPSDGGAAKSGLDGAGAGVLASVRNASKRPLCRGRLRAWLARRAERMAMVGAGCAEHVRRRFRDA